MTENPLYRLPMEDICRCSLNPTMSNEIVGVEYVCCLHSYLIQFPQRCKTCGMLTKSYMRRMIDMYFLNVKIFDIWESPLAEPTLPVISVVKKSATSERNTQAEQLQRIDQLPWLHLLCYTEFVLKRKNQALSWDIEAAHSAGQGLRQTLQNSVNCVLFDIFLVEWQHSSPDFVDSKPGCVLQQQ